VLDHDEAMLLDLAAGERRIALESLVAILTTGGTVAISEAGSGSVAAFARHARASEVTDLDAGHICMVSKPEVLAAILNEIAARR
jgi:hypothetical protein